MKCSYKFISPAIQMFQLYKLENLPYIFRELENSCKFENITKGREGANLFEYKDNLVPIVRTTTPYINPVQHFSSIHYTVINEICTAAADLNLKFNNALIEIYNDNYSTMKFHSDQELDLEEGSYICIFSCYNSGPANRKLIVKNKNSKDSLAKSFEFLMGNNSVIIFSTETNRNFAHKIIRSKDIQYSGTDDHKWLGLTFRLSKCFIKFINEIPYFYPGQNKLTLATEEEKREFFKIKGRENWAGGILKHMNGFLEPPQNNLNIFYTLSPGDLLPIE